MSPNSKEGWKKEPLCTLVHISQALTHKGYMLQDNKELLDILDIACILAFMLSKAVEATVQTMWQGDPSLSRLLGAVASGLSWLFPPRKIEIIKFYISSLHIFKFHMILD